MVSYFWLLCQAYLSNVVSVSKECVYELSFVMRGLVVIEGGVVFDQMVFKVCS